jgi:hypothetical protein
MEVLGRIRGRIRARGCLGLTAALSGTCLTRLTCLTCLTYHMRMITRARESDQHMRMPTAMRAGEFHVEWSTGIYGCQEINTSCNVQ